MIDQMASGVSAPQGLTATSQGMPANVPPMDPSQMPPGSMPPGMMMQPPQEAPPKPPSLLPSDVAKLLAEAVNNAKMEAASGLTSYLGDPRGNVSIKWADMLKTWRKRSKDVDPLYEKFVNRLSDDEITNMMYPARRALTRYGRRTYSEQVEFAEHMAELDADPRYKDLDNMGEDEEHDYIPPQSRYPSRGEETYKDDLLKKREEERIPAEEQD